MSDFTPPQGVNFRCRTPIPIVALSEDLRRIASFLRSHYPQRTLRQFEDWWQHDGLHFYKESTDIHSLFLIASSPRDVFEEMPGDDYVRVGIAPRDNSWYLRFYADWDDEGLFLQGDYDITLQGDLVLISVDSHRVSVLASQRYTSNESVSRSRCPF